MTTVDEIRKYKELICVVEEMNKTNKPSVQAKIRKRTILKQS